MGSKFNKALEFIGVTRNSSDDDFEDDFYEKDEEEVAPQRANRSSSRYGQRETKQESSASSRYSGSSRYASAGASSQVSGFDKESSAPAEDAYDIRRKKPRLSSISGGVGKTMIIHSPSSYSESQKLVQQLKQHKQVIVKLDTLETEVAQRILDFMSGASFALEFQVAKISKGIYLFASSDTRIEKPEPVQPEEVEEQAEDDEAFYTLEDSADIRRR